jgi:type II secretory pathway component PulF
MERDYKIRQRLRMATLYPKLLVLAVIFIPSLPTLVLEGGRPYLDETLARLVPLLLWVTGLYVGYLLLCQVPVFRYGVDLCKLAIPKIGSTVKMLGLSKFYRAFASLYDAGTSPSMAISHASRVCGNWFLTRKLQSAIPMVESGRSFTEAMEQTRIMPRMAIDMLAVGEQAGNVAEMVDKVADFTENEAEVQTHQMTMILGVLLILGVALFIGFQVVGYYMGYYNQILNMK